MSKKTIVVFSCFVFVVWILKDISNPRDPFAVFLMASIQ